MDATTKDNLKRELAECLAKAPEIRKVVVFGSFLRSESPNDMDVAIFQETGEPYLPLALKYRRMARSVSARMPLDIIPLRPDASGLMMDEIGKGEVIYER